MPIVELIYTTKEDPPITFCMMVNSDEYLKYQESDSKGTIPIASIFNSFDVFRFDGKGKEGIMSRPSKSQLKDAFHTTNDMDIAQFMLENGSLHGQVQRSKARTSGEEQGVFKNEPMTFKSNYHS